MHFAPRATRTFNISEIVQNQIPDAEGNIIPTTVHEGSATLGGSHGDVEHILVAMDSGTYNVRKATCGTNCVYCDGYTSFAMNPGSATFAVQRTQLYQFIGTYSSGTHYNVANGWSSSNTPVATINSSGVATGLSLGSANFITSFDDPVYVGQVCSGGDYNCPSASGSPSGGGTVTPDHLLVISDVTSVACTSNNTVKRQIKYWEVDANGNQVGTEQTKEQFASKGPNSCNTTITTSETCSTDAGGQLIDQIFVGCNSVGGSCGTTYTKQQWLYCPSGGTPVVFATPGDLYIHNDSILVGGSAQFSPGTKIGPNGVMP